MNFSPSFGYLPVLRACHRYIASLVRPPKYSLAPSSVALLIRGLLTTCRAPFATPENSVCYLRPTMARARMATRAIDSMAPTVYLSCENLSQDFWKQSLYCKKLSGNFCRQVVQKTASSAIIASQLGQTFHMFDATSNSICCMCLNE
jgi:hypothetical protein